MKKCDLCKNEFEKDGVVVKPYSYALTYSDHPDKVWETLDGAIVPLETESRKEFCTENCANQWIEQQEKNFEVDIKDQFNHRSIHYSNCNWQIRKDK